MNIMRVVISSILVGVFVLGCKDDGTMPEIPERVKLTLIDVSVNETFLHINVTSPTSNETLTLKRNGTTIMSFAAVADTNIADTALSQSTMYQYTAALFANNAPTGSSNTVSAQTLVPTSHNLTWQTFLLGDGNNSSLSDVAIINDTLIYAVGEMYLRDSTGAFEDTPYNLAKWNGQTWEIKRVTVATRFGSIVLPFESIFAFSPTDIWVGAGSPIHWDGQRWTYIDIRVILNNDNLDVSKAWGTNSSNMYFVGRLGNIVHFDGNSWQKLESGTTTRMTDIWGVINPVSQSEEMFCSASSFFTPGDKRILKISSGTSVDSIRWDTGTLIYSVWTNKGFPIFTAGQQVFENKTGTWSPISTGAGISTNSIRGASLNDIVVAGDFGYISHYNGLDWQMIAYDFNAGYSSVRVSRNLIVAAGNKNGKGLVVIGSR